MKFEEHCEQSLRTFGNPYPQVHKWLDELAFQPPHFMKHRQFRHHLKGIEEVRKMWGDEAAEAARQHIEEDLRLDGWRKGEHPFPKDQAHYNSMGLY